MSAAYIDKHFVEVTNHINADTDEILDGSWAEVDLGGSSAPHPPSPPSEITSGFLEQYDSGSLSLKNPPLI